MILKAKKQVQVYFSRAKTYVVVTRPQNRETVFISDIKIVKIISNIANNAGDNCLFIFLWLFIFVYCFELEYEGLLLEKSTI